MSKTDLLKYKWVWVNVNGGGGGDQCEFTGC